MKKKVFVTDTFIFKDKHVRTFQTYYAIYVIPLLHPHFPRIYQALCGCVCINNKNSK